VKRNLLSKSLVATNLCFLALLTPARADDRSAICPPNPDTCTTVGKELIGVYNGNDASDTSTSSLTQGESHANCDHARGVAMRNAAFASYPKYKAAVAAGKTWPLERATYPYLTTVRNITTQWQHCRAQPLTMIPSDQGKPGQPGASVKSQPSPPPP
jgi:hypothetical protein